VLVQPVRLRLHWTSTLALTYRTGEACEFARGLAAYCLHTRLSHFLLSQSSLPLQARSRSLTFEPVAIVKFFLVLAILIFERLCLIQGIRASASCLHRPRNCSLLEFTEQP
jgi:hypothetical protein